MTNIKVLSQTQRIVVGQGVSKITALTAKNEKITVSQARGSVSVINAGPIGPTGAQGLPGPSTLPVGTVLDYAGAAAPSGFLMLDGSTVTGGQTTYADLWAVIPASWKSGANIVLPDARGRTTVGAGTGSGLTLRTLGTTGGNETHVLTPAETAVKGHSHTFTGTASQATSAGSAHTHIQNAHTHTQDSHNHTQNAHYHDEDIGGTAASWNKSAGGSEFRVNLSGSYNNNWTGGYEFNIGGATATNIATTATNQNTTPTNQNESAHTHTITASGTVSTLADGANGSAHNNMQPWLALNKIIRAIP